MVRLWRFAYRFVGESLGYFQKVRVGDEWVAISFIPKVINILHSLVWSWCHSAVFVDKFILLSVLLPFLSFTYSCI